MWSCPPFLCSSAWKLPDGSGKWSRGPHYGGLFPASKSLSSLHIYIDTDKTEDFKIF